MAYDKHLVARVRARLNAVDGVEEIAWGDGWGVARHGHPVLAVVDDGLIVRVGADGFIDALAAPGARPFDADGLDTNEWVSVLASVTADGRVLSDWIARGVRPRGLASR